MEIPEKNDSRTHGPENRPSVDFRCTACGHIWQDVPSEAAFAQHRAGIAFTNQCPECSELAGVEMRDVVYLPQSEPRPDDPPKRTEAERILAGEYGWSDRRSVADNGLRNAARSNDANRVALENQHKAMQVYETTIQNGLFAEMVESFARGIFEAPRALIASAWSLRPWRRDEPTVWQCVVRRHVIEATEKTGRPV